MINNNPVEPEEQSHSTEQTPNGDISSFEVINQNVLSPNLDNEVRVVASGMNHGAIWIGGDPRVDVRFQIRTSIYYSVTEAEIETYAQFGWLTTILLTILGILWGLALGCIVALLQGNLSASSQASLISCTILGGILGLVFLLLAVWMIRKQSQAKKDWKNNE